jgi:hypothetical protein
MCFDLVQLVQMPKKKKKKKKTTQFSYLKYYFLNQFHHFCLIPFLLFVRTKLPSRYGAAVPVNLALSLYIKADLSPQIH